MRLAERVTIGLLVVILGVTGALALTRQGRIQHARDLPKPPEEACVGEPIYVDADYEGAPVEPHSCLPACADNKPRYLLYRNGKATQCGLAPKCFDDGEDKGMTCAPGDRSTVE